MDNFAVIVQTHGEAPRCFAILVLPIHIGPLVPRRSGFDRLQSGQFFGRHEQLDRPGLSRNPTDQAAPLERDDHVVDRRWCDLKEPLKVRFGGRLSVKQCVGVDERQILALLRGESRGRMTGHGIRTVIQDVHEHTLSRHADLG